MMLQFFKQIAGPAVFAKGFTQYKQGHYGIAKPLIVKAAKWMPELKTKALYRAVFLLCDCRLGQPCSANQLQELVNALENSPHKDTDDYTLVVSHIKQIMDTQ